MGIISFMSVENPTSSPEKRETKKDDARKFIIGAIDHVFLEQHGADARDMTVDWTEVSANSETKVVRKIDDNGLMETWKITKVKVDGSRNKDVVAVDPDKYDDLVAETVYHLEKRRYEFHYEQNGIKYTLKYDVLEDGLFYLLEVDAEDPELRARFDKDLFARQEQYELIEVSGDEAYEGYRIVDTLAGLRKSQS